MAKHLKVLRETNTSVIVIRKSVYLLIPMDMIKDTSFPLVVLKNVAAKLKKGATLKLKMLKDKLVVEEE